MKDAIKLNTRLNISDALANTLRDMIFDGRLAPGERINEVRLAAQLGFSRTPLREALSMLVAEGALSSLPRRGFFVRKLTAEEIKNIYPLRQLLDPEALRLSGVPEKTRLGKLETLNERIFKADKAKDRIKLDDQWHLMLVEDCPNPVLVDLIRQFIRRTRRYELAYSGEERNVRTAYQEHKKIIRALGRGDMDNACRWLKQNMTSAGEPILRWLESRGE
jgi:DNA-binding GntR family transcriptional regulator